MSLKLGTTSILGISTVNTNVSPEPEGVVTFYDYDGTVLYTYTTSEFLALSAMPSNPTHTGMIAQGWNWTLSDAQQYVTNWGYLNIGQNYTTSSGATEIFIEIPSDFVDLSFNLRFAVNGTASVDWGDNTTPDTVTGSSLTTVKIVPHTYTTYGNYCISISLDSGTRYGLYNTGSNYPTLSSTTGTTSYTNLAHANTVKEIHCGNDVQLGGRGIHYLYALRAVSISTSTSFSSAQYIFNNVYSLGGVVVPNTVSGIGSEFIYGGYSIQMVCLPRSLKTGQGVLIGQPYSLRSITLPDLLSSSSFKIFTNTNNRDISSPDVVINAFAGMKYINRSNVTMSPSYSLEQALYSDTSITEINWPQNISNIPGYVFNCCKKIKEAIIPNTVVTIGNYAFSYCYSLTSAQLPNTVTSINGYVFNCCYCLKSVQLSNQLGSIAAGTFSNCQTLRNVDIPTSVTDLGMYAFAGCYCLSSINLPTALKTIGQYTFQQCFSLTKVTIPSAVTSIGNSAFSNCPNIKEYHILATDVPTLGSNVFSGIASNCKIYVPQASLSAYQSASNWSTYASYMVGE